MDNNIGYGNNNYTNYGFRNFNQGFQNPQPQTQGVSIRIIDNENDIRAGDVPMDGTYAVFLMRDHSAVYIRTWSNNGTIEGIKFVPDLPAPQPVQSQEQNFTTAIPQPQITSNDILKLCDNISIWSQQQAATTESISRLCDTLAEAQNKTFNHSVNKQRYNNKGE